MYAVKNIGAHHWTDMPWILDNIRNELHALSRFAHPNIVELKEFYESSREYTIVMELMPCGDLLDHVQRLGPMPEADIVTVTKQVASALCYMHDRHYVHCDLKPDNIFVADSGSLQVKVGDLGQIYRVPDAAEKRLADKGSKFTTLEYACPEVYAHAPRDHPHDMWSLGVTLFVLLTGAVPFDGHGDTDALIAQINAGRWALPRRFEGAASRDFVRCLKGLLDPNPATRMTVRQLLAHPWLQ
jgi:serine/threonine protein kinase